MAAGHHDDGSTYSPRIAFIYVFNLIVGTGALALPSVLTTGGWVLGTLFLLLVAFTSFVGVTFMIESMAAANALSHIRHAQSQDGHYLSDTEPLISDGETSVIAGGGSESDGGSARAGGGGGGGGGGSGAGGERGGRGAEGSSSGGVGSGVGGPFEIVQRMEMAQMADMFFGDWGRIFFYIALILYLFGDAAIYCTFVPRSLVAFFFPENPPPWAFDAFLTLFVAVIVPFCFFDFQKTKPLQIVTMVIRNAAISTMIIIAAWVAYNEGPRTTGVPNFRIGALPNLFGGAVYAFMCHHSLPGIITPMREKAFIPRVLLSAFLGVFLLYLLLFLSCGIAFGVGAEDPITFNFSPAKFGWIGDLLFLFPVVTLSSNYPMLTITLRNNLDTLLTLLFPKGSSLLPAAPAFSPRLPPRASRFSDGPVGGSGGGGGGIGEKALRVPAKEKKGAAWRRVFVTLLATVPPIACCVIAEHNGVNVNSLVGATGAYAGAAVMFIIPACLVYRSRCILNQELPQGLDDSARRYEPHPLNQHASPFRSPSWVTSLVLLAILVIGFISIDEILY
ncbi:hypothetical protein CLOM_g19099 [Closterium sp. NIES-68]|nr:hypothetical protein CLOM_g19099 [Closterium sp. NIES-68]GJP64830.1 hypothetical protein CLOP_g21773 [Closterium sp. NIES-67]